MIKKIRNLPVFKAGQTVYVYLPSLTTIAVDRQTSENYNKLLQHIAGMLLLLLVRERVLSFNENGMPDINFIYRETSVGCQY